MKRLLHFILLTFVFTFSFNAAADAGDDKELEEMSSTLKRIEIKLKRGQFDGEDLSSWTKVTIQMKSTASLCVSSTGKDLDSMKTVMEGLGEKVKGEDSEVTKKRLTYQKKKGDLDKVLAKCNLYIVNSDEVSGLINEAEKSYFKQKYLVKSPDIIELAIAYMGNPVALLENSSQFIINHSGINEISGINMAVSIIFVLVSLFIGFAIRKKLLLYESKQQWQDVFSENFLRATLVTLAAAAPYLLTTMTAALASIVITMEVAEFTFLTQFLIGLLVYYVSKSLIVLLLSPPAPAEQFIPYTPGIAEGLAKRLKVLIVLGFIGYMAFYTVFSESIVQANLFLLRDIFSLFVVANIAWALQVILKSPHFPRLRYLVMLVIVALLLSLVAEWMGYRNIAFAGRRVILSTFAGFAIFYGLSTLLRDMFNAIDDSVYPWCRRVHKFLGVEEKAKVPGLIWIRVLTTIIVWGAFAYLFIDVWDYSGSIIERVKSGIVDGFDIGDTRIVPGRILWALLAFAGVIIFSSWFRSQLENHWLKMTSMAQGARDALVTITGYVLFLVALLSGLSVAGFDFSNIAIIAGALSVGIGFGLQNIVNNFVSGLVLLFERPIRKGDWIVVGETEGYVKDIQIRATRIQTFDRSDVIVPNSELISGQVTNWVLSSKSGRAIIPVGVAYGSDTEKVRDILMEIAENNDDIDISGYMPKPRVLFREFGDSSLNFEMRVFLKNVDNRLVVISDVNFAIDKAFREAAIEIPFPQRDLHIKNMPVTEAVEKVKKDDGDKSMSVTESEQTKSKD
jgi:potassium efflux system protein